MTDIYKIIEEYNPNKAQKTFVVVGDVIVDIPRNNPALSKVVTNKRITILVFLSSNIILLYQKMLD